MQVRLRPVLLAGMNHINANKVYGPEYAFAAGAKVLVHGIFLSWSRSVPMIRNYRSRVSARFRFSKKAVSVVSLRSFSRIIHVSDTTHGADNCRFLGIGFNFSAQA